MIQVEHLFFSFDQVSVLKDVSFSIQKGEFIGLFGPNGGGKTTLCRLLAGLLKPNRGRVSLSGKVAFVPQNFAPDPLFPISVLEVVLMGRLQQAPRFFGYSPHDRQKAFEALKTVGLEAYKEYSFSALSGGQKQRVLVARALASEPDILILDEATANMDSRSILGLLKTLKEKSYTILMVTHQVACALDNCDRLLCVQGSVKEMSHNTVCQHFKSGLYHGVTG